MVKRYNYKDLTKLQLNEKARGIYESEFKSNGFIVNRVKCNYRTISLLVSSDKGIKHLVHIRSVRGYKYIYFKKKGFPLRPTWLAAIALLFEGQMPQLYLIPSTKWEKPNSLLKSRDYSEKKSDPEWGINLSKKNMEHLEQFVFNKMIRGLCEQGVNS